MDCAVDVLLSLADSPLTELLTPFPDVLTDGTLDVRDMITLSDNSADAQVPFTLGAALTCCVYECLTVLLATRVQTCFSAFWVDASCFRWGAGGGLLAMSLTGSCRGGTGGDDGGGCHGGGGGSGGGHVAGRR
jgi:uncharacterized membrane protein YgcG